MKKVLIVVINYKLWKDTIKCINSILNNNYKDYSIVVIDNSSGNDSIKNIELFLKSEKLNYKIYFFKEDNNIKCNINDLILIESKENLGFSGGCNIGIEIADNNSFDYVYLLNNDAIMLENTLEELVSVAEDEKVGIVGSVIKSFDNKIIFDGVKWPWFLFGIRTSKKLKENNKFKVSGDATGSSMLISLNMLRKRKEKDGFYFDPKYFLYCEETDVCRFYVENFKKPVLIAKNSVILHEESKSSGGKGNIRTYYYFTRNRILLANRWLNFYEKILFHLYYVPSRIIIQSLKLLKDRNFKRFLVILEALRDGYIGRYGKWKNHDIK